MDGSTGRILADLVAAGLVVVGALGVVMPAALSQSFGLPVDDAHGAGFVRAASVRDMALGALILTASVSGAQTVLFVGICAGLLVSTADFVNVFYAGGRELHRQHITHAGGAVVFAVILALLITRA